MCDCCPIDIQNQICPIQFKTDNAKENWIEHLKPFKVSINRYNELPSGNPVAKGGYGEIFPYIIRGEKSALKKIKDTKEKNLNKQFLSEVMMLSVLKHENIIKMTGYTYDLKTESRFIILEWMDGCDLGRFIHCDRNLDKLAAPKVVDIALQIAHGMRYIHSIGVLHNDLKSSNVMYNPMNNKVKIIDFGLASMQTKQVELNMKYRVLIPGIYKNDIRYWMAPEKIEPAPGQLYNEKSDVFSYGLILYELGCGKIPYRVTNIIEYGIVPVLHQTVSNIRYENVINEKLTENYNYVLLNAIMIEQSKRPDFHFIIKNLTRCYHDLLSREQKHFEIPPDNTEANLNYLTDKYLETKLPKDDNKKNDYSMLKKFFNRFSKKDDFVMYRYARKW